MRRKYEFKLENIREKYKFRVKWRADGGKGSGNWGHAGRPGEVGGSQPNKGAAFNHRYIDAKTGEYTSFAKEKKKAASPHKATTEEFNGLPVGSLVIDGDSVYKKITNNGDDGYDWYDVYSGEVFDTSTMEKEHLSGEDVKVAIPASSEVFMKDKVNSEGSMFGGGKSGAKESESEETGADIPDEKASGVKTITSEEEYKEVDKQYSDVLEEVIKFTGGKDAFTLWTQTENGESVESVLQKYAKDQEDKQKLADLMSQYIELQNAEGEWFNKKYNSSVKVLDNPWKDYKSAEGGSKTGGIKITSDEEFADVKDNVLEGIHSEVKKLTGYKAIPFDIQMAVVDGSSMDDVLGKYAKTPKAKGKLADLMGQYVETYNAMVEYKLGNPADKWENPWKDYKPTEAGSKTGGIKITSDGEFEKVDEQLGGVWNEVLDITKYGKDPYDISMDIESGADSEAILDKLAKNPEEKKKLAELMSQYVEMANAENDYLGGKDPYFKNPWKDYAPNAETQVGNTESGAPKIESDEDYEKAIEESEKLLNKFVGLTKNGATLYDVHSKLSNGLSPEEIIKKYAKNDGDKQEIADLLSQYVECENAQIDYENKKDGTSIPHMDNPWKDYKASVGGGTGEASPTSGIEITSDEEYDKVEKQYDEVYAAAAELIKGSSVGPYELCEKFIEEEDPSTIIEKAVKNPEDKQKLAELMGQYVDLENAFSVYYANKFSTGDPSLLENPWKDLKFGGEEKTAEKIKITSGEDFEKAHSQLTNLYEEVMKMTKNGEDPIDLKLNITAGASVDAVLEKYAKNPDDKKKLAEAMSQYIELDNAENEFVYGSSEHNAPNPWKDYVAPETATSGATKKVAVKDVLPDFHVGEITSDEDYKMVSEFYSDLCDSIYAKSKADTMPFELQDDFKNGEDPHDIIEKYCKGESAEEKAEYAAEMSKYVAIQNAVGKWNETKWGVHKTADYEDPWKDLEFEDTPKAEAPTKTTGTTVPLGKSFEPSNYSDERVANAKEHTKKDSYSTFAPTCSEVWSKLSESEQYWLWKYTMGSKFVNEPLTGRDYMADKTGTTDAINDLTSAIDQAPIPVDCKLIHGIGNGGVRSIFNISKGEDLETAIKARIGQVGYNGGFMSCGADTATNEFAHGKKVLIEVYVPKGAKGMYCEPFSHYGLTYSDEYDWDGDLGSDWESQSAEGENEIILQRGGFLKIRGYKVVNGKPCVICDLVGQDPDKVTQADWEKHIKNY